MKRKLFVQDLTIFMDVEANPGPDQLLNGIVSRSAEDQVTGIKLLGINNNGIMTYYSSELRALCSSLGVPRYVYLTIKDCGILKTRRTRAGKRVERRSTKYRHYVMLITIHAVLLRFKLIIQDQAATDLILFRYKQSLNRTAPRI